MAKSPNRVSTKKKASFLETLGRELRSYGEAFVFAFVIITFVFTTVGVVGASMEPNFDGGDGRINLRTILTGDRVFIPKYETWLRRLKVLPNYQRGDVLVVREPKHAPTALQRARNGCNPLHQTLYQCRVLFIKRLIAVAGDRLKIEGGEVYVNGVAMNQDYITGTGEITPYPVDFPVIMVEEGEVRKFQGLIQGTYVPGAAGMLPVDVDEPAVQTFYGSTLQALAPIPADAPEGRPFVHELIIPEGHVFVMGDNRERGGSEDSRYFGPIPTMTIAGQAQAVIWPPRRDGAMNWRRLPPPAAFADIPEMAAPAPSAQE